jgi:hypothetical protein
MAERLADPAEVRAHLVAAAADGRAITYADLLERLGYRFSRPKMRALCAMLGAIDSEAAERGEPKLAVLVVRQSDGIPGQGWWRLCRRLGRAGGAAIHRRRAGGNLRLLEVPFRHRPMNTAS